MNPPAPPRQSSLTTLGPRSRRMVAVMLWIVGVGGTGAVLLNQMTAPLGADAFAIGMLFPIMAAVAGWQLRRGNERTAMIIFVWGMFLASLINAYQVAGVRTPNMAALSLTILLGSWLLSPRHGLVLAAIAVVFVLGLGTAQQLGVLEYPNLRPPLNTAVIITLYLVICVVFGITTTEELREENQRTAALSISLQNELDARKRSEAHFITLFRSNPLPSQISNADGIIADVNDSWIATFGVPREQAVGKRPHDLAMWHDIDELRRVMAILEREGSVDGEPISLYVPTGEVRHFLLTLASIEMADAPYYAATLIDQTDRLNAEKAQREMNEELEKRVALRTTELTDAVNSIKRMQDELVNNEKLASLGAMVAGISHELNTPIGNAVTVLSTLRDRLSLLREAATNGNLKRSTLDEFFIAGDGMTELAERSVTKAAALIASFKQVSVDQTSERRRDFGLRTLVEDVVATLRPGLKHAPIEIRLEIPDDIICDSYPGPLGQIVTNLVQNAATHAFEGRDHGLIRVVAERHGDTHIFLNVADDGKGMDRSTLARVFDPFFTTKLGKGGSGLGLSICHRLATTVLGGTLGADATPGAGSTFRLTIPVQAPGKA